MTACLLAVTALAMLGRGALAELDLAASHAVAQAHPIDPVRVVNRLAALQVWMPLVLLVGAVLWVRGRHRAATTLVLADLLAEAVTFAVKLFLAGSLPLPEAAGSTSWVRTVAAYPFPSGHVVRVTVTLIVMAVLLTAGYHRARVPAVLAAAGFISCISLSRMIAGAHSLSQVAGGCLLGLAMADLAILSTRRDPR